MKKLMFFVLGLLGLVLLMGCYDNQSNSSSNAGSSTPASTTSTPTKTKLEYLQEEYPGCSIDIDVAGAAMVEKADGSYFLLSSVEVNQIVNRRKETTTSSSSSSISSRELDAELKFNNTHLLIINNDSFDWTNVNMRLNNNYTYTVTRVPAGDNMTIAMDLFINSSGTKFNGRTTSPKSITITAKEGKMFLSTM